MKQRRHGKKVFNWHRPLGRFQLKHRFIRARENPQPPLEGPEKASDMGSFAELDFWPYEISNYCCENCYREAKGYGDEHDLDNHSVQLLLDTLLQPDPWVLDLEQVRNRIELSNTPSEPIPVSNKTVPIAERLAEHMQLLIGARKKNSVLYSKVMAGAPDTASILRIGEISKKMGTPHFGRLILLFSPFWIRNPMDWTDNGEAFDLLRFLFVRHETPGFLFPVWLRSDSLSEIHLKWVLWLIIIGQGGSLKLASRHFPWAVSKKYQRYLLEVPEDLTPTQASQLAETRRLGGSLDTFRRLMEFRFFHHDPSEDFPYEHRAFWEATVRWLAKYEAELNDDECRDLLQWAIHEHTERHGLGGFNWKNRSVAASLRMARAYVESLGLPDHEASWPSHGWDCEFDDDAGITWTVTELVDSHSLAEEGRHMRHCVAFYANRCQAGACAIFSLKRLGVREITIEVDLSQKRVAQARGKFNRATNPTEEAAISHWFASVVEINAS